MKRHIDFLVVPQGKEPALNFRLPTWLVKTIVIVLSVWVLGMIIATIFLGRLTSRAVTADLLERENERLRNYNAKVIEIEKSFRKNLEMVARIAKMAGIEIENINPSPSMLSDSIGQDSSGTAIVAGLPGDRVAVSTEELEKMRTPKGRPLYGWITRGFQPSSEGGKEKHEGIDIAVREGTPIVATATGEVTFSGWDKAFGNLIVLDHGDGYQTMYGHNQKNLVSKGQKVYKGDMIALSGNTGRSSAPHLHYEVMKDGAAVDPSPYLD
jgi:murein DD-endopeptidase MepM/ murein hydrolase activator NlpD